MRRGVMTAAVGAAMAGVVAVTVGCGAEATVAAVQTPVREIQHADSTALFIGLSVVDGNVAWASGSGGRVARTTDGGATWQVMRVPDEDSTQFRDVHAFSATEAVVLSIPAPESRIYRTVDGGATWTLSWTAGDPAIFMDCLAFWDRERGFAMGDSRDGEFTLLRTDDGGASWTFIDPAAVPDARPDEGAFAASGTCAVARPGGSGWFVTGASGVDTRVIRTTDHGATWAEAVTPIPSTDNTSGIFSLVMVDDTLGLAFGGNLAEPDSTHRDVALTTDGGATWTLIASTGLRGAVYGADCVVGPDAPVCVAVSPDGVVWSPDGGRNWTRIDDANTWTAGLYGPGEGWVAGQGHISRLGR